MPLGRVESAATIELFPRRVNALFRCVRGFADHNLFLDIMHTLFHARRIIVPVLLRPSASIRLAHTPISFRNFSATPTPQASESDAFLDRFRHTEIFKKLADKPEVLAALSEFAGKMKEQGI